MTDTLHQEPERDHFKSESPIRAFTTWIVQGDFAIGKGFRPSLSHLVTYLDAMQRREGWQIVQILEAGSQTPSMLFRCVRQPTDDELRARHPGLTVDLESVPVFQFLNPYDCRVIASLIRVVTGDMMETVDHAAKHGDDYAAHRDTVKEWIDDLNKVANRLVPDVASEYIGKAHKPGCSSLPNGEKPCNCGGNPNFKPSDKPKFEVCADAMEAAGVTAVYHDKEKVWEREPIPELVYWSPEHDNFYGQVSRRGQGNDFYRKWHPRRAEFPQDALDEGAGDLTLAGIEPAADDPVNPKHYGGTGCAEVIENMPGNCAHAVTYLWRAGDKPDQPEVQEAEKALWFLKRELVLAREYEEGDDDLLPGQCDALKWHVPAPKRKANTPPRPSRFYDFAAERIPETMPPWRKSAITDIVRYVIGRDEDALKRAADTVAKRIVCLKDNDCPEFGRQQEP